MKHKCVVTHEYPVNHKPPVLAEIYIHGEKIQTRDIEPIYTNPIIEELEKIKAEFSNLQKAHHIWLIDQDALIDECSEIIDKHIAELKGENK